MRTNLFIGFIAIVLLASSCNSFQRSKLQNVQIQNSSDLTEIEDCNDSSEVEAISNQADNITEDPNGQTTNYDPEIDWIYGIWNLYGEEMEGCSLEDVLSSVESILITPDGIYYGKGFIEVKDMESISKIFNHSVFDANGWTYEKRSTEYGDLLCDPETGEGIIVYFKDDKAILPCDREFNSIKILDYEDVVLLMDNEGIKLSKCSPISNMAEDVVDNWENVEEKVAERSRKLDAKKYEEYESTTNNENTIGDYDFKFQTAGDVFAYLGTKKFYDENGNWLSIGLNGIVINGKLMTGAPTIERLTSDCAIISAIVPVYNFKNRLAIMPQYGEVMDVNDNNVVYFLK